MAAFKFTKRFLDSLESKVKPYDVWDSEIKGFMVTVFPSGRKTLSFRYYDSNKTNQKIKIGVFGNITCETARDLAKGLAGDLAKGIDPKKNKTEVAIEPKVQEKILFLEFFEIYTQKHRLIHHKPSTFKISQYIVNRYILPFFGDKYLGLIAAQDILNFKDFLKEVPGTYNKCSILLHKAFQLAELWGYREKNTNPCTGIQKHPEKKMERFLKEEELRRLERVLEDEEASYARSPYILGDIRMLMYTGCRMGEVLTLKWENVHLDDSYLQLTDSKTGARIVPLNEPAKRILGVLQKQDDNLYVFCGGKNGTSHVVNIEKAWQVIRRKATLEDVRLHDLRHSFASFAIKKGLDLYQVAKLLGHKNIHTTTRYAHLAREDLIKASDVVAKIFEGK
jgi:integrase